jgi:DNA-binding NarL/FixJ family response regulator
MKTLLIDDHALLRETLAAVMKQTWPALQVLQAGSLAEACTLCDAHPDLRLILVDLGLPDAVGMSSLITLRERAPHARRVVVSADDRPQTVLDAIEAGAVGFIPKTSEFRVMADALDQVLRGGVYLPHAALYPPVRPAAANPPALSPRQLTVLGLLVDGHSNKSICRQLDLSASTVKTHLETIFLRLAVTSRSQAVIAVARLGLRLPG